MSEKRCIEKADLFRLQFISEARLSPDGQKVIYGISHVDSEKEEEHAALWMLDLDSGNTHQFTSGKTSDGGACWSPDGKTIAFLSGRDGAPQIFIMPVDGGEAKALTSIKQGVGGGPFWSPDGKFIAFTTGAAAIPDYTKPYRVTRHIYRFNGIGYLEPLVQGIYIIPAAGGEARCLTQDRWQNTLLGWSPDGQELLYTATFAPDSSVVFHAALRSVNLKSEVFELVPPTWGGISGAVYTPDGKSVFFSGTPASQPVGTKTDLWTIRRRGGKPECRTAGLKIGLGGNLQGDMPAEAVAPRLLVSSDSQHAFVPVQDGGHLDIYAVALQGAESVRLLAGGDRNLMLLARDDHHMLYAASTFNDPINLYLSDLEGKNEQQLTHLNEEFFAGIQLPTVEHLLFPGGNGETVEGWLMKPTAAVEKPYPTILYIHGGPQGAFGSIFSFDFHMLAGAGYAVLFINPHGSTGYGSDFTTAINGDPGNLDFKDLMAGVDFVIARGWADSEKLGVCGLSYGGYMSCWAVGQTDRFKAAVPENPVTNWISMYGVSDISADLLVHMLGGKPHEALETYRRCSPISYAHRCTTPTLLIQGEADYRCPAEQSEQFYTVLKANGCVVEMLRLPNASHVGSIMGEPIMRRVQNEALLEWMDRYVLGKTAA